MNPSQFFLSPVNLGGLAILILLDVTTVGWVVGVGRSSVALRGVPSGTMMLVGPPPAGLIKMVPIHPVFVSIDRVSSP